MKQRIEIIDGLRGFALSGILLVHCLMFFLAGPLIPGIQETSVLTWLDGQLGQLVYWLGLSKFFSIFSILFGLSFYIQQQSATDKNQPFAARYCWKMALLFCFGLIHWGFFPGDILTMYAVIAVLLLPLNRLSTKTLLVLAIALQLGAGRAVYFLIYQGELLFAFDWWQSYSAFVSAVTTGSLQEVMATGYARYPQFWNEQLGLWGRFYSSLSYFIIGLLIGRAGWLANLSLHRNKFKTLLFIFAPLAAGFFVLHLVVVGGAWGLWNYPNNSWLAVLRFNINQWFAFSLTVTYLSAFVLLAVRCNHQFWFKLLTAYGRTGLTTYLSQSLLGTLVFYHWGLGLLGQITVTQTIVVFVVLLVLQISFSYQWLKYFKQGPLEWLWRSLTLLRITRN